MKTLILLLLAHTAPAVSTVDYYKCTNRVTGEWNFGRAPSGCDASAFGSDSVIKESYPNLVFKDSADRTTERKRYMDDLHSVIRDAAEYYLKKRKPTVSAAELEAFKLGILTTAAQESFWSHYRFASDNRYKMMRGDVGHGHGMMQVDDRAHFPAIQQGLGWNFMGNMTYALDIFYAGWQNAPKQSCVGSESNYTARTRAAWAAYNGGPAQLCRWINTNSAWAANDKGFNTNLVNKSWKQYVTNFTKKAPIDVPCLMEKRENCSPPGDPTTPTLRENVLYRTAAGTPCVVKGSAVQCMSDFRDAVCLRAVSSFTNANAEVVTDAALSPFTRQMLDRHTTCAAYDATLLKVGSSIEAKSNINLRATPGGGLLGLMATGTVAEILDFELRNIDVKDRYYKINLDGVTGWVYAGVSATQSQWVIPAVVDTIPAVVARAGEKISIVNAAGINMRATPGGTLLLNVPAGRQLTVIEYAIQGANNSVYYKVSYSGKTGYLYSGELLPKDSTGSWTKRIK